MFPKETGKKDIEKFNTQMCDSQMSEDENSDNFEIGSWRFLDIFRIRDIVSKTASKRLQFSGLEIIRYPRPRKTN